MKCQHCDREVALAKVCPYCGRPPGEAAETGDQEPAKESSTRGEFKGRLSRHARHGGERAFSLLPAILRYFADPVVPRWKKTAVVCGLFYLVWPLDLVPGALLPFLGWLDDAAVVAFTWRLLAGELARYRRGSRGSMQRCRAGEAARAEP